MTVSELGGSTDDVELVGDFAYLAASAGGLHVVDISDPGDPLLVANLWQIEGVRSLQSQGDVLYLATADDGLVTLDISEPSRPLVIGSLDVPNYVRGIAVASSRVYLGANDAMYIIDVADARAPVLLGVYDAPGTARNPVVVGDVVYLPIRNRGVDVIDVSDPSTPMLLTTIDSDENPMRLLLAEDRLYVTGDGVQVLDISDPRSPSAIATIDIAGSTFDIEVVGDLGYVMVLRGLLLIDLTSPDDLQIVGFEFFDEGGAERIRIRGDIAYIAGLGGGLHILDISNASDVLAVGGVKAPAFTSDIQVNNDIAYLLEGSNNLRLMTVDVSEPEFPVVLGWMVMNGEGEAIDVDPEHGIAYIADSDHAGVHIVDISDPRVPTLVDTVRIQEGASRVLRSGDRLFVDAGPVLQIYDVTDRLAPALVGEIGETLTRGFDVVGNLLFLATSRDGLRILNIANPAEPLFLGEFAIGAEPAEVVVVDQLAYVAVENRNPGGRRGRDPAGLYIIDVRNPAQPTLVSFIDQPQFGQRDRSRQFTRHIKVHNSIAYLGDSGRALFVYDVADPAHPRLTTTLHPFGNDPPLWFDGDLAFGTGGGAGLVISDISRCRGCRADIDGDSDLDAEDFFGYLDLFTAGDDRADIDGDGELDAEDFFGYLDLFVAGCA